MSCITQLDWRYSVRFGVRLLIKDMDAVRGMRLEVPIFIYHNGHLSFIKENHNREFIRVKDD